VPRSSRSSLRVLTIGPQGTKITRFAIESRVTDSLFAQPPYVHVTRPQAAVSATPPPPPRHRRVR